MRKAREIVAESKLSKKLEQLLANEIQAMNEMKKNRLVEIIGVFAKHNFYSGGLTPVELRTTLEDMGPTYVKIGQIMSSRADLLPQAFCDELGTLRSNVKPLDPEVARPSPPRSHRRRGAGRHRGGDRQAHLGDLQRIPRRAPRVGVHRPGALRRPARRHPRGDQGAAPADRRHDAGGLRLAEKAGGPPRRLLE